MDTPGDDFLIDSLGWLDFLVFISGREGHLVDRESPSLSYRVRILVFIHKRKVELTEMITSYV